MSTYIIFDLDETLGHFTQLGILWESLQHVYRNELNQTYFNCICDLYPNFLRPSILTILRYLKSIKQKNKNIKIIVYTNNQGPTSWCDNIISYLEHKIKYNLFDQIVYAYKINGKHIELNRTTHDKTYNDIKKCINCFSYDKICFIDDQYHPGMNNKNICYINVKPYNYNYDMNELINIFTESECNVLLCKNLHISNHENINKKINNFVETYSFTSKLYNDSESKIDKNISKKILYYLHKFIKTYVIKSTSKKTLKKYKKKTVRTKKTRIKKQTNYNYEPESESEFEPDP